MLQTNRATPRNLQATVHQVTPMEKSQWIRPAKGNAVKRLFSLKTFSTIERAYLRYASINPVHCRLNGKDAESTKMKDYSRADITALLQKENNTVEFILPDGEDVIAEVEILLNNGERIVWNTDVTWLSSENNQPVITVSGGNTPSAFAPEEHLAVYEVKAPTAVCGEEETRMYISYKGDVANAYLNGHLTGDSFYDGTDWILSLNRLKESIEINPMVIRIDGLKSADAPIYFEKNVVPADCVIPTISDIRIKQEYRFDLKDE